MQPLVPFASAEHGLLNRFLARIQPQADIPLRLSLWNGAHHDLGSAPQVTVRLSGPGSLRYFLPPSLDNLADGYVNGHFDVQGRVQDVVAAASKLAHSGVPMHGRFGRLFNAVRHDRARDARAIEHHYDVSNDFYRLWLDPALVYSCAYFPTNTETLAAAQNAKLDHILTKIMLKPGERLLDLGCGWGALVMRAAQKFGAKAVTIIANDENMNPIIIIRRNMSTMPSGERWTTPSIAATATSKEPLIMPRVIPHAISPATMSSAETGEDMRAS